MLEIGDEYERIWLLLTGLDPGTKEYDMTLKSLSNLVDVDLKIGTALADNPKGLDKVLNNGALLGLIGNVVLGVMIMNHERANVITTKAFSLIKR